MHKSGHWFVYPEASFQLQADALVAQVMKALEGTVDGVTFEEYALRAEVFGRGRILSVARAVQATKALQQALDCPLKFVSLQPQSLTLHVMHPLFKQGLVADLGLRFTQSVPVEDWIQGLLA